MKISEQQLIYLVRILEGTLNILDSKESDFILTREDRIKLWKEIISQQDRALKDIGE